jgi:hypothetical protein
MKPGDCKHFNGVQNDCCSVGVNYSVLALAFKDRPCLPSSALSKPTVQCARFEAYTKADEQADEESFLNAFANVKKARAAITEKHGTAKPAQNIFEKMKCPCCSEGELHYRIASCNGHIHASCTIAGCVNWME